MALKKVDQKSAVTPRSSCGCSANELDQSKFAIDVRERIAKYDARMVELRKIGKRIDPATVAARDAIAAHNELCDNGGSSPCPS